MKSQRNILDQLEKIPSRPGENIHERDPIETEIPIFKHMQPIVPFRKRLERHKDQTSLRYAAVTIMGNPNPSSRATPEMLVDIGLMRPQTAPLKMIPAQPTVEPPKMRLHGRRNALHLNFYTQNRNIPDPVPAMHPLHRAPSSLTEYTYNREQNAPEPVTILKLMQPQKPKMKDASTQTEDLQREIQYRSMSNRGGFGGCSE